MRLTARRQDLLQMSRVASGTTSPRSEIQVLSHLLLECQDSTFVIKATDTELCFSGTIDVEVDIPGRVSVPASTLLALLPYFTTDEVKVESDSRNYITITSTGRRPETATIYGTDAENFPVIPQFDESSLFRISRYELAEAIERTIFCCSTDPLRFYLQGALFEAQIDGKLRIVATDSRRLAVYDDFAETVTPPSGLNVIIPARALREVQRVLEGAGDVEVDLSITEKRAFFRVPSIEISTAILDGRFPDYRGVLPKGSRNRARVNGKQFAVAVDFTSRLLDKDSPQLRMDVHPDGIEMSTHASPKGIGAASVDIDSLTGESVTLGMHHRYLRDALQHLPDDLIEIGMNDPTDGVVLQPVAEPVPYFFMVMPMRLEAPEEVLVEVYPGPA